jgi:hypothetical protein
VVLNGRSSSVALQLCNFQHPTAEAGMEGALITLDTKAVISFARIRILGVDYAKGVKSYNPLLWMVARIVWYKIVPVYTLFIRTPKLTFI